MPDLKERLEDFGAGWHAGAESVLDMWQDGIDPQTAAHIVSSKTTRRRLLSALMLGLAALVSRIAARGARGDVESVEL